MHQIQRVHVANHVVDRFSPRNSQIQNPPRTSPQSFAHGFPRPREEAIPVGGDLATVREAEDNGSEGGGAENGSPKVESDDEDREVEEFRIFMSYCSFPTLKILLKNYLGCEDGDLDESVLKELEEVVELARMTPTDISEVLVKNRHKKEKTVYELLETLKLRAEMNEKMKS
ncbi:hypothetical protein RJT34_30471 [Clitoria ternatea]|uniref:AAA+ ATPase At3g28540-like C-terminal domain-containing protein n=1 Tax=Clitoria ternatea TaxID=43366 RepID=A0AAN9EX21_CLITE